MKFCAVSFPIPPAFAMQRPVATEVCTADANGGGAAIVYRLQR